MPLIPEVVNQPTPGLSPRPHIPISAPFIGAEERAAVLSVLDSGMLAQGPLVAELESRFAQLANVRHAVATSSGTTALWLALLGHRVGPGDEVVTTPFTFVASVNAILLVGATPVFADVEEETFNLDPDLVEAAITPRTRAILAVHLYGQPCRMDRLAEIALRHGVVLLEDAAQAVGASFAGRPAGSFGTAAWSLYATKNVMAGEGGLVTTDDDEVAERVQLLRSHGMRARYQYEMLGYNFRMTDLGAALALAQLDRLEWLTSRRRENAAALSRLLTGVATPVEADGCFHVWHQYTVRLPDPAAREAAVSRLADAGVGTGVFYPVPVHRFDHVRRAAGEYRLPVSERLAETVLSLPVHPLVETEDLKWVATCVNRL